ncbi:hypothetical protein [Paenarthrobacter nitroguajacolicus]
MELKSEWDLTDKKKTGNLARLILGFANRDPAVAAKYLGGEAYLVLGVDSGRAEGLTKADSATITMQIQPYTGTRGPQFVLDYGRFNNLDVAVITILAAPRAAHIYALEKEFTDNGGNKERLWRNGTIFVRSGTSTEVATAEDIRRLERRLIAGLQKLTPQVHLEWQNDPRLFWHDESSIEEWLESHREHLLSLQDMDESASRGPFDFSGAMMSAFESLGKQTPGRYKKDLNEYIGRCRSLVDEWTQHVVYSRPGFHNVMRMTNTTDEAVLAVRLTLQLPAGMDVVVDDPFTKWPELPVQVGKNLPPTSLFMHLEGYEIPLARPTTPRRPSVDIDDDMVKVTFDIGDIAAEDSVVTWPVAVLSSDPELETQIEISWSVTANNRRGTDRGTLSISRPERQSLMTTVLSRTVPVPKR